MADLKTADPRRRFAVAAFFLTTVGALIAGYLLWEHWTGGEMLGCSKNALFDCNAVNRSVYSEFKGIPFALLGLAAYLIMAVLCARRLAVGPAAGDGSLTMVAGFSVFALAVDGTLGWIQFAKIQHYCPWCIASYVVTAGLLATSLLAVGGVGPAIAAIRKDWDELGKSKPLAFGLLAVAVASIGFVVWRPAPVGALTWCPVPHVCTNAPGGKATLAELFSDPSKKARETIEKAQFLDPGPGGGYAKGAANPVLTIVEFGDLECPACRHFSWGMDQFLEKHPNEVRWVFRHYPLDQLCNKNVSRKIHEYACATARAAEAAGEQGKFWEYENDVYKMNDETGNVIPDGKVDLTEKSLEERARRLGLKVDEWKKSRAGDAVMSKILDDVTLGAQMDIQSTPTLFVNGRMVSGGAGPETMEVWLEMAKKGELDPKGPKSASR